MRLGFAARVVGAGLFLLAAGCAHKPRPIDFGPHGPLNEGEPILAALAAHAARVQLLSGEARLNVVAPEGEGSVTELVAVRRPDQVRLESVTPFGPVSVFASDGRRWALVDHRQRQFVEGPLTSEALEQVLPVRVSPRMLVALLLGAPPLPERAQPGRLTLDAEKGLYRLEVTGEESGVPVRWRLGCRTDNLRPELAELVEGPGAPLRVELEGWLPEPGLPQRVRLVSGDGARRVELAWRDVDVGEPLEDEVFQLVPPEDYARPGL